MQPCALAATPAVEGAFVSGPYNFGATMVGPEAALRAGPGGTALGRFGWMASSGRVYNMRTAPDDALGLVLPECGIWAYDWRRVFYNDVSRTWRVREGLPVVMITKGNVYARFDGGAYPGQQVYANTLDGSAIAGYSPAGEPTPWSVTGGCAPGGLGTISTWSTFTP